MTELLNQEESGLVQDLRLSFSRISAFDQDGPKTLVEKKELSGEGVLMGGLIDMLLFEPDKVKDNYYIFEAKVPTATAKELADIITNNYNSMPSIPDVLKIIEVNGFWSSIKKETTLTNKFNNDDFWGYLKAVFESKDKQIVSKEDYIRAEELVEVLRTHKNSKERLDFPTEEESKYVQVKLDFNYKQFNFRGIVDLIVVNHTDKTIKFIDLKTGAPAAQMFSQSFVKYRYYLQALLYTIGAESFKREYSLEDYRLLPFEFLYISRYQKIPLVYEVPTTWELAALRGFTTKSGYKYKGLDQLIAEIDWHWTHKEFDLPMEIVMANGLIVINDDFIEVNE
jgi:hypothetical protein